MWTKTRTFSVTNVTETKQRLQYMRIERLSLSAHIVMTTDFERVIEPFIQRTRLKKLIQQDVIYF